MHASRRKGCARHILRQVDRHRVRQRRPRRKKRHKRQRKSRRPEHDKPHDPMREAGTVFDHGPARRRTSSDVGIVFGAGWSDSQTPKSEEIQVRGVRGEPLSLQIGNPLRLESTGRWAGRRSRSPTRPLRRWRPSTFARAVVLHALGRFATWSRRGPSRRPVAGQSDGFETRAAFKRIRWHTFAGTGFIIFLARKSVSYIRSASCVVESDFAASSKLMA